MGAASAKRWLVHTSWRSASSTLYGEPGSGKSVLAGDIGLHVAAGMAWHDRKVRRSAVLCVAHAFVCNSAGPTPPETSAARHWTLFLQDSVLRDNVLVLVLGLKLAWYRRSSPPVHPI